MATRTDARFSTYSGAPSIQPSLAPTYDTQTSTRSSGNNSTASTRQSHTTKYSRRMTDNKETKGDPYKTAAASVSTSTLSSSDDPKAQDIKSWTGSLERMQDERLVKQRYVMSGNKSEEVSKLALGAKVERALARRMTGQDATFTVKKREAEKMALEVEAN